MQRHTVHSAYHSDKQSKKSKINKVKKPKPKKEFNKDTFIHYFILLIVIVVGIIFGAIYLNSTGVSKTLLDSTGFFMQDILCQQAANNNFFSLAISSFFPIGVFLCLIFLFGLCAVGMPFEVLLALLFGFWTGGCLTSVYLRYGVNGLGISLIFILPQMLLNTVAILVSVREGFKVSTLMSKVLFKSYSQKFDKIFKLYCYKFIICFILVILSSLVEAGAIKIFALLFFT